MYSSKYLVENVVTYNLAQKKIYIYIKLYIYISLSELLLQHHLNIFISNIIYIYISYFHIQYIHTKITHMSICSMTFMLCRYQNSHMCVDHMSMFIFWCMPLLNTLQLLCRYLAPAEEGFEKHCGTSAGKASHQKSEK